MQRLLFVFLDGVGLGAPDAQSNPFVAAHTPFLRRLLGGPLDRTLSPSGDSAVFASLDAGLGCAGLPQSATGQTALLTGVNGAALMGRHYGPWPGPTLKRVLDEGSLFNEAMRLGGARLANAYPPGYFSALEGGRFRENVPVYAARSAGVTLPTLDAYRRGEALAADLTGEYFARIDSAVPTLEPSEMGARLAAIASSEPFTFFDFWQSDRTGHRASLDEAVALVERLDRFLEGVVCRAAEISDLTVLITSDHGNLEQIGDRRHSHAPVPLIATGPGANHFGGARSLLDVAPAVRGLWGSDEAS